MSSVYRIELDGSRIRSKDDFFRELSAATGIAHVDNLDALADDLTGEIAWCHGRYALIWRHADKSDWSGYSDLSKILGVLFREQQAFPEYFTSLQLEFDPDPSADTWTFSKVYNSPYYAAERQRRGVHD
jgi:RNAse (barnase) inhibitor barstar